MRRPTGTGVCGLHNRDAGIVPMRLSRPWYVYLMAVYAFFGMSGFATSLSGVLFASNPDMFNISRIIILFITIALVVGIIKMDKTTIEIVDAQLKDIISPP